MSLAEVIQYAKDISYAVQNFETGITRRDVVKGYFVDNKLGKNQKLMYDAMLDAGFKRTTWQIVFEGQTAGLIRKIDPPLDGMDEMHVRFYNDGNISAEIEYSRFSLGHWRMAREEANSKLIDIVHNELESLSLDTKERIQNQIAVREHETVDPDQLHMPSLSGMAAYSFIAIQYPLTTTGTIYLMIQGDIYAALTPMFVSTIETVAIITSFSSKKDDSIEAVQPID